MVLLEKGRQGNVVADRIAAGFGVAGFEFVEIDAFRANFILVVLIKIILKKDK